MPSRQIEFTAPCARDRAEAIINSDALRASRRRGVGIPLCVAQKWTMW